MKLWVMIAGHNLSGLKFKFYNLAGVIVRGNAWPTLNQHSANVLCLHDATQIDSTENTTLNK